jgi:hypothetical protein
MYAACGGARPELAIHAEAFTGSAEQSQKHDRECIQKQKPVAPVGVGDA